MLRRRECHNNVNCVAFNTALTMADHNTTRGTVMRAHIQNTLLQALPAGATSSSLERKHERASGWDSTAWDYRGCGNMNNSRSEGVFL